MIPDDVLLEIFDVYVSRAQRKQDWHTLVHVCRRWRCVVFESPHRLDLRLLCTYTTPVKKRLRVWPELPIVILGNDYPRSLVKGAANIVAALEHRERIREIDLQNVPVSVLAKLVEPMQEPFPSLRQLALGTNRESALTLSDTFLAGSVPNLQNLRLTGIPFPELPNLLLSASHLVELHLDDIPHPGYISPEAMGTCLSALTRLKSLNIKFRSPFPRPDPINHPLPPLTRVTLPTLSSLRFKGVSDYLEDLVAQIDTPLLRRLSITFFHQLVFDTPQLLQFVGRPNKLKEPVEAQVVFLGDAVGVSLYSRRQSVRHEMFGLVILCRESDWQLSSLAQICSSILSPLRTLECLNIGEDHYPPHWYNDMENIQWVELLQPFTLVKDLYLSKNLGPRVLHALDELTRGGVTEVLPALQNIFVDEFDPLGTSPTLQYDFTVGPRYPAGVLKTASGKFVLVAPRLGLLSGHPVAVHRCPMNLVTKYVSSGQ